MVNTSIALCTYNGERYLFEQLESYLKQSRQPDELVVCDDHSTDGTLQIIREFAANAPFPVRVNVNPSNVGTVKNFEKAISLCTGDLIFLSDQDDIWWPTKIEKIVDEFKSDTKTGLVFTNAALIDEKGEPLGKNLWEINFKKEGQRQAKNGKMVELILNSEIVTGATMAFRSSFKEMIKPIPDALTEIIHDKWIALIIAAQTNVRFLPQCLTHYRQHASQQIGAAFSSDDKYTVPGDVCQTGIGYNELRMSRLEKLTAELRDYCAVESVRLDHFSGLFKAIESETYDAKSALMHFKNRRSIRDRPYANISLMLRELLGGRYGRYSRGWLSATKDLLKMAS